VISALIQFLEPTGSVFWVNELKEIESRLSDDLLINEAAHKFENMFGGMGSLNDLIFCQTNKNLPNGETEKEFNERFSSLMNNAFKELRLLDMGVLSRLQWMWLDCRNKGDLPPRIKKTFR